MPKDGDILVAKLNLRRLAKIRVLVEKDIKEEMKKVKDSPIWGLPDYDHYLDNVLDTTEN